MGSFPKVTREDLRGYYSRNVASFSGGPSPHEDCLAEDAFVDDVRGGVLETERVKHARQEEVQFCRGMGFGEPVLRKDMDAEGAKAVSLRWIDTDKGGAGRPNYRSRLVVREIKKGMTESDVPSAAERFSGMPPLESVTGLLSLFVSHSHEEANGKRTLAMYDMSCAHFHGGLVRRVLCKTPEDERKRGSHARTATIWNSLASWEGACMAQSMPVLFGKCISRRSSKNTSSSKVSAIPSF